MKSQKDNPNEDSEEKFKVKDILQITITTADDGWVNKNSSD